MPSNRGSAGSITQCRVRFVKWLAAGPYPPKGWRYDRKELFYGGKDEGPSLRGSGEGRCVLVCFTPGVTSRNLLLGPAVKSRISRRLSQSGGCGTSVMVNSCAPWSAALQGQGTLKDGTGDNPAITLNDAMILNEPSRLRVDRISCLMPLAASFR